MPKQWRWKRSKGPNEWIGLAAAFLGIIGYGPLLWNIYTRQEADDFSWSWVAIRLTGVFMWLVYAWRERLLPVLINMSFFLVFALLVIVAKLKYEK